MFSRPERSLETSLQWLLGLLSMILLAGLLGLGLWLARESTLEFVSTRLAHDAENSLSVLRPLQADFSRPLPPIYQQPLSGHYVLVRFDDGALLRSRSLWDETLPLIDLPVGAARSTQLPGPLGQHLLVWSAGYEKSGRSFTLSVAEDISPLLRRFDDLLGLGLALALAGAVLLLSAQKLLLRRMFRRLDTVHRQLRDITVGRRNELDAAVPSEIRPLVNEFNQLLRSLQAHLQRARHAAGNLAHALKGRLQLIEYRGRNLDDAAIDEQTGQMRRLIDRELHRARLAGSALAGRHFRAAADLEDLADTILALHCDKELMVEKHVEAPDSVPLDQDDMLELLGNLLDNAAKWASAVVCVRLSADPAWMELVVEDDGPGIDEEALDDLKGRGKRLDEKVQGHGLGLDIVADVVESYAGRFDLDRSPRLHGLRVTVRLPLSRR